MALATAVASAAWPAPAGANEVARDAKYLIDNTQLDLVDVVTSPLHAADEDSVLRSPTFYLVFAGIAGVWAGSFALDQTIRSHLHNMSPSTADLLQRVSYGSVGRPRPRSTSTDIRSTTPAPATTRSRAPKAPAWHRS